MPGMLNSTSLALDQIENFPPEEQKPTTDIYFLFESIQMCYWVLYTLVFTVFTLTFYFLTIPAKFSVFVIIGVSLIPAWVTYRAGKKKVVAINEGRQIKQIKKILENNPAARSGFSKIRNDDPFLGPNIRKISAKHGL